MARSKNSGKTVTLPVGILIENQYEDQEFWYPYYRMQEAGLTVDVIGPAKGGVFTSKHGYPAHATIGAGAALKKTYRGLVIPGGYAPDLMRRSPAMVQLVQRVYRAGGFLAAICHGGWMLCSVPETIRGRTVSGFFAIRDDLTNAGAVYVDREVAEDGPIITSRKPSDLPAFMKAVLSRIG